MTASESPAVGLSTRPAAVTNLPPHGTLSRRKYHGCDCDKCRTAYNSYQRSRYRRVGYGTWQPFVDADPVRQHLANLRAAGYSAEVVANAIGQYVATINAIIYPVGGVVRQRVRPALAEAILAVTPESLTPALLPAAGSTRRIHALIAAGWTTCRIAQELGVRQPRVPEIARQKTVTRSVADRMSACYEKLRRLRPEDHGVTATAALRSRLMAERKGWRDPLWWEDMGHIDDPDFDPATAERELNRDELGALRREEIEHLASYGCDAETIAKRLHMHLGTVRGVLRELRTGERRNRKGADA
ncbi:hypothetical protein [Streptomyces cinereoruber]|uniref:hypothetical protein n=1 Tax=Streptomyces cinereoruber TaxID=67260 RepID=UPI0036335D67